jgi:hypothetical protein
MAALSVFPRRCGGGDRLIDASDRLLFLSNYLAFGPWFIGEKSLRTGVETRIDLGNSESLADTQSGEIFLVV